MESLALLAALIGLAVLVSGPLAVTLPVHAHPYLGRSLGAIATVIGVWWAYTVRGSAGWVGILSAALGLWTVLQAYHHDAAQ